MSEGIAIERIGRLRSAARYAPALVWLSILALGGIVHRLSGAVLAAPLIAGVALATAVQIGIAIVFYAFLTRSGTARFAAFIVAAGAIAAAPLLIPSSAPVLRFVASCASVVTTLKLWDLHAHVGAGLAVERGRFLPYLVNVFSIVLRKEDQERRPSRSLLLRDLRLGAAGSLAGLVAVASMPLIPWSAVPLLVEHAVKATVVFASILAWMTMMIAAVRLAGGSMRDFSDAPLRARTPAEFWRRYNRVFQQFFYENVFIRAAGRRSPAAATLFIFVLSGLIHEYVFAFGVGRVQGFQLTFFLLQGIAVAATLRVKPRSRPAVVSWTAATLAFNVVTSLLFFLSFHALVPMYENPLPAWLQR